MKELFFFLTIFLANIIQGITGFAGTILAMPFGIMLMGYDVTKPVLNVLGLLSGIYVFLGNREHVNRKELKRIVLVMVIGIFAGMGLKNFVGTNQMILYQALGSFVVLLAVHGLYRMMAARKKQEEDGQKEHRLKDFLLLTAAGVVHGIFVSGGPLLIGYLTGRISDKRSFRATISTVWILLNTIILIGDIHAGMWNKDNLCILGISFPVLMAGMFVGGKLYRIMSQKFFMILTYVLLLISGVTLFCK
ncbi:MAG: sulfite exporter TauE/SafE family protein [Lachnospiraceae bacterium]|nr:sulfite exporter TauE/SafE family protein [Lachnospiraceae bacterium]